MGVVLFLLLIVAPLVELYVIIQVAHVIGPWQTIALLVVESLIGAWLLKHQGLSVLRRASVAVNEGRVPGKEVVDGLLLLVAGALMLAPGFVGDVIGWLLLLPPTRALIRIPIVRRFEKGGFAGLGTTFASTGPGGARFVGSFRVRSGGDVVDVAGREHRNHPQLNP